MIQTDICIIGAGPGGAAAALQLAKLGIPCVLVDKAQFPRDKICGDGMTTRVTNLLRRLDPVLLEKIYQSSHTHSQAWGVSFVQDSGDTIEIPFRSNYNTSSDRAAGLVAKRVDFDNMLVEAVREKPSVQLLENTDIQGYVLEKDGYLLQDKANNSLIKTKVLIVANGAHSWFARHIAGIQKEDNYHAAAIRAYYSGVTGCHKDGFIELHFSKKYFPGYFWIFPLPNGGANVGVGMLSAHISKHRVNLKTLLTQIITETPQLQHRFQNAHQEGKTMGFGLPLGGKKRQLVGERYMLVGDAASLIEPMSGEGIGIAMQSGVMAAEQAATCIASNDFSAKSLAPYDARVHRVIGKTLALSKMLQRIIMIPFVFNLGTWLARTFPKLTYKIIRFTIDVLPKWVK